MPDITVTENIQRDLPLEKASFDNCTDKSRVLTDYDWIEPGLNNLIWTFRSSFKGVYPISCGKFTYKLELVREITWIQSFYSSLIIAFS